MKYLLNEPSSSSVMPKATGVKLPKIAVPTFNGNILNWTDFWVQFEVVIHCKNHMKNAEKLAYL